MFYDLWCLCCQKLSELSEVVKLGVVWSVVSLLSGASLCLCRKQNSPDLRHRVVELGLMRRRHRTDRSPRLLANVAQAFPGQTHLVDMVKEEGFEEFGDFGHLSDSEVWLQGFSEAGGRSLVGAHLTEQRVHCFPGMIVMMLTIMMVMMVNMMMMWRTPRTRLSWQWIICPSESQETAPWALREIYWAPFKIFYFCFSQEPGQLLQAPAQWSCWHLRLQRRRRGCQGGGASSPLGAGIWSRRWSRYLPGNEIHQELDDSNLILEVFLPMNKNSLKSDLKLMMKSPWDCLLPNWDDQRVLLAFSSRVRCLDCHPRLVLEEAGGQALTGSRESRDPGIFSRSKSRYFLSWNPGIFRDLLVECKVTF